VFDETSSWWYLKNEVIPNSKEYEERLYNNKMMDNLYRSNQVKKNLKQYTIMLSRSKKLIRIIGKLLFINNK
jgi:hypothetical protein